MSTFVLHRLTGNWHFAMLFLRCLCRRSVPFLSSAFGTCSFWSNVSKNAFALPPPPITIAVVIWCDNVPRLLHLKCRISLLRLKSSSHPRPEKGAIPAEKGKSAGRRRNLSAKKSGGTHQNNYATIIAESANVVVVLVSVQLLLCFPSYESILSPPPFNICSFS